MNLTGGVASGMPKRPTIAPLIVATKSDRNYPSINRADARVRGKRKLIFYIFL